MIRRVNNYLNALNFMTQIQYWQNMAEDKKLLIKKIAIAAIGLYVLVQLVGFLLPIAIFLSIGYWGYKSFIDQNPRVLR